MRVENLRGQIFQYSNKCSRNNSSTIEEVKDVSFKKAVDDFETYAKDRIKNGPEKFQIGGSAMSLKDWEHLMKKVDTNIEYVKEELKDQKEEIDAEKLQDSIESNEILNNKIQNKKLLED